MKRVLLPFAVSSLLLVSMAASASAQCVTCTGAGGPGEVCISAASGWGSCTTSPDPDIGCKLSCPNCPTQGCDDGGGGGGCLTYSNGFDAMIGTGDQSVISNVVIFRSNAPTNAHLFGGRGYLVVPGAATSSFNARTALDVIGRKGGSANVRLSFAATNVNESAIPTTFVTESGEAFTFAPRGEGTGAHVQFRVKSFAKLSQAVDAASIGANDVLLVDLRVHGQVYILALHSESISRSAADFALRVRAVQEALRQSLMNLPRANDGGPFKYPSC
jgi:hypothetical protein